MDYYAPNSWYEDDYEPEHECRRCDEKDKIIERSNEYLSLIVEMLYDKSKLDIAKLDDLIGELCNQLDVDQPNALPNIKRPDMLNNWIESNNNYLKALI